MKQFNTHRFKVKCSIGTITIPALSTTGIATLGHTIKLNQAPNAAELQTMYDRYRIDYVKFYLVNRTTGYTLGESWANANIGTPEALAVVDYDDVAVTASVAGMDALRESPRCKGFLFTSEKRAFSLGFKPAVLAERYRSAITTSYTPMWGQYIDMQNADVDHFGLKMIVRAPFTPGSLANDIIFDLYQTMYLTCKDTR